MTWPSDFQPALWWYQDVRSAITLNTTDDPSRWVLGCAEHGLSTTSSENTWNGMGAAINWALYLAEEMRYNAKWDMNWVLCEEGNSHAQLQYENGYLTRTPAHYVYEMAQQFYGFEYHSNIYQSPLVTSATAPDGSGIFQDVPYVSSDVTVRVFRNPADGHYHLFVINANGSTSVNIDGWQNWTVLSWNQLLGDSFDAKNPLGQGQSDGTPYDEGTEPYGIMKVTSSYTPGTPLTIPPISINHIELEPSGS